MQIDDEMHAGATHAVANGEMIIAILGRRRLRPLQRGALLFRAVPELQSPSRDRKRAFWRHCRPPQPSDPTRVPASGVTASECRPTSPRTDRSQRLVPT